MRICGPYPAAAATGNPMKLAPTRSMCSASKPVASLILEACSRRWTVAETWLGLGVRVRVRVRG